MFVNKQTLRDILRQMIRMEKRKFLMESNSSMNKNQIARLHNGNARLLGSVPKPLYPVQGGLMRNPIPNFPKTVEAADILDGEICISILDALDIDYQRFCWIIMS